MTAPHGIPKLIILVVQRVTFDLSEARDTKHSIQIVLNR